MEVNLSRCPACGSAVFQPAVPESTIEAEMRLRHDFVSARLHRKASRAELKDLTDFMHGMPAPLVRCAGCGLLARDEAERRAASDYEEDANDPDLMQHLLPRYVDAFRNKERAYRDMLPPSADVLEIGSHIGGFLQVAEEWNWRVQALDVGRDTSEFARANGFRVRRETAEETGLKPSSFDAVFIWNCFEQIGSPAAALSHVYRLLKPFGLLVLRVPNALFYESYSGRAQVRTLAWNNLLGFPYLYGYTAESLNLLLEANGFKHLRGFNSELVTMPFADLPASLEREQKQISPLAGEWSAQASSESGRLSGPWIEMLYRKLGEGAWKARTARRGIAPRLSPRRVDLRFLRRAA